MGKGLLFTVAGMILTAGLLASSGRQYGLQQVNERTHTYQAKLLAREIALTGMSEAEGYLHAEADLPRSLITGTVNGDAMASTTLEGAYMGGTYTVSFNFIEGTPEESVVGDGLLEELLDFVDGLTDGLLDGLLGLGDVSDAVDGIEETIDDLLDVLAECTVDSDAYIQARSNGAFLDPAGGTTAHVVQQLFEVEDRAYPDYMDFALHVNGNLELFEDSYLGSLTANADVHVNGDLSLDGNGQAVLGFGNVVGNAMPAWDLNDVFSPLFNPLGLLGFQEADSVQGPVIDPSSLHAQADVVINNSLTIEEYAEIPLGTYLQPKIIYVEGDLTINTDSLDIVGYGAFVVEGDVFINAHLQVDADLGECDGLGIALLVYAAGDIDLYGNSYGYFMTASDLNLNNGSVLVGGAVATGNAEVAANAHLQFRRPVPSLIPPFGPVLGTKTYREWDRHMPSPAETE